MYIRKVKIIFHLMFLHAEEGRRKEGEKKDEGGGEEKDEGGRGKRVKGGYDPAS